MLSASLPPATNKRLEGIELALFLLILVPAQLQPYLGEGGGDIGFYAALFSSISRFLAFAALALFFLWRNGEGWRVIGWSKSGLLKETLVGVVLFLPCYLVMGELNRWLVSLGLSAGSQQNPPFLSVPGPQAVPLMVLMALTVALSEETIFRGYLLHRFARLTGSTGAAVLLSTALFALGHGYQGGAGVLTVGTMGLVFCLVRLWRGSLTAPATLHLLQNLTATVLIPWIKGG